MRGAILSCRVRGDNDMVWRRWARQPQRIWLRRALFQIHMWSGIGLGLYVLMISVTGSVLVYRNELLFRSVKSPGGMRLVSQLTDLHDNLFAGDTGRTVNGAGAIAIFVMAFTGLVIWWPGIKRWRRSLTIPRGIGWQRATWHLHSVIGFWSVGFTLLFAASGMYLCYPDMFQDFADRIDPPLPPDVTTLRISDEAIYWLAYLHFGRINGIGIPCHGPGLCDQTTKAVWALFGMAPAVMFITGALMWWTRVIRPRWP